MAREKISKDEKLRMTMEYVNNSKSIKEIATANNISEYQVRDWVRKFKALGENA